MTKKPRTLTAETLQAGMKRAGPVPTNPDEMLPLISWLVTAGYGKACLPSLVEYIRLKHMLKLREYEGLSSRKHGKGYTREAFSTALKGYGIHFPGTSKKTNATNRAKTRRRQREEAIPTLDTRLARWKSVNGLTVKALCEMHGAKLSVCRVALSPYTRQQGTIVYLYTPSRIVAVPLVFPRSLYVDWEDLNQCYHFNVYPRPLP